MTNEAGEFPSVCNKSVQAQSTDIQPAIPVEVFRHILCDLKELPPKNIEKLGRLGFSIHKPAGADQYTPISWDEALQIAVDRLAAIKPERSFFYASGRSSNESGFIFQLFARLYTLRTVPTIAIKLRERH